MTMLTLSAHGYKANFIREGFHLIMHLIREFRLIISSMSFISSLSRGLIKYVVDTSHLTLRTCAGHEIVFQFQRVYEDGCAISSLFSDLACKTDPTTSTNQTLTKLHQHLFHPNAHLSQVCLISFLNTTNIYQAEFCP